MRFGCARDLASHTSKGPEERGWSRGREIYRRDLLCSDCKARAENRLNGSAEQKPAPEFKQRDICCVLERRDLLDLQTEIQLLFSFIERTFFVQQFRSAHNFKQLLHWI